MDSEEMYTKSNEENAPIKTGKRKIVELKNVHKTYILGIEGITALRYKVAHGYC